MLDAPPDMFGTAAKVVLAFVAKMLNVVPLPAFAEVAKVPDAVNMTVLDAAPAVDEAVACTVRYGFALMAATNAAASVELP